MVAFPNKVNVIKDMFVERNKLWERISCHVKARTPDEETEVLTHSNELNREQGLWLTSIL